MSSLEDKDLVEALELAEANNTNVLHKTDDQIPPEPDVDLVEDLSYLAQSANTLLKPKYPAILPNLGSLLKYEIDTSHHSKFIERYVEDRAKLTNKIAAKSDQLNFLKGKDFAAVHTLKLQDFDLLKLTNWDFLHSDEFRKKPNFQATRSKIVTLSEKLKTDTAAILIESLSLNLEVLQETLDTNFNDEVIIKKVYNACIHTLESIHGKDEAAELLKEDSTRSQLNLVANRVLAECHDKWRKHELVPFSTISTGSAQASTSNQNINSSIVHTAEHPRTHGNNPAPRQTTSLRTNPSTTVQRPSSTTLRPPTAEHTRFQDRLPNADYPEERQDYKRQRHSEPYRRRDSSSKNTSRHP